VSSGRGGHNVPMEDGDLVRATRSALARAVSTRPRRWLVGGTAGLGVLAAAAVASGSPDGHAFLTVSGAVQGLMSIALPLTGVLLVRDLRRAPGPAPLAPTLLAAGLLAAAVGLFGVLVSVIAVAAVGSTVDGAWDQAVTVAVGSIALQVVAQLVGTGLAQLVRSATLAFLGSIVLPLGLWFLLGWLAPAAREWLTPFANGQRLYRGELHGLGWLRWAVAILLWAVGLNGLGAWWRRRAGMAAEPDPAPAP
jgi:hypothetical protein